VHSGASALVRLESPRRSTGAPDRIRGRRVVVVEFEANKIAPERIYWDQRSLLAQVGLLDSYGLALTRHESAQRLRI